MTPIVIVGAGGMGRETLDFIDAINAQTPKYEVIGFLADGRYDSKELTTRGAVYLGGVREGLTKFNAEYVIAIGSSDARREIDAIATAAGRTPVSIVHPTVTIG